MFRTVWSKTLRAYRIPLLSWGIGLALILLATLATFGSSASQMAGSLNQLAQTFRFIGDPIALNTATGFATWRTLDLVLPAMLSIWTIMAGTNLIQGEEERASIELLLATSTSRLRLLLEKGSALVIALLIIGLLIGLGAIAGLASAGLGFDTGRALLAGLNVSLLAFFYASLALLLSQLFPGRKVATSWSIGLLVLFTLLDSTGRIVQHSEWMQYLSPNYYYGINKPLITTYDNHPLAALLLLILSMVMCAVSAWLFERRDLGASIFRQFQLNIGDGHTHQHGSMSLDKAWSEGSLRSVGLRTARALAPSISTWLISFVLYVAWIISLTPSFLGIMRDLVSKNAALARLFSGQDVVTNAGFIGYTVFSFIPLLVVIFVFTLALQWARDLDKGRLELIFSTPQSRLRVLGEHIIVVLLVSLVTSLVIWLSTLVSAQVINIRVDSARIVAATLGILPLELIIAATVYACAARLRAGTVQTVISLYLAWAYLVEFLRSVINAPDWLMSLSIFHVYGTPILDGWQWGPNLAMLGIASILFLLALLQFRRVDIDRGN
ncbi:ABC transporter permease subunit [Dictyobacter aurantiacus]|uniref:ABC transporter permease n=1 Tax=Dictyobacter aurantiacus TaxID=1936993 RepID=A0A401ZF52_9CHLR|nr:ABC transporter permease subunit [Dictyobacter aurantiacus]GCE05495.1 hypothetical protein KDAU_28240 [Dictyobacter aurantiacus]